MWVKNGDVFVGTFVNGEYAKGRYTVKSTGQYFEGTFKNGQPDKGNFYDKNGTSIDANSKRESQNNKSVIKKNKTRSSSYKANPKKYLIIDRFGIKEEDAKARSKAIKEACSEAAKEGAPNFGLG